MIHGRRVIPKVGALGQDGHEGDCLKGSPLVSHQRMILKHAGHGACVRQTLMNHLNYVAHTCPSRYRRQEEWRSLRNAKPANIKNRPMLVMLQASCIKDHNVWSGSAIVRCQKRHLQDAPIRIVKTSQHMCAERGGSHAGIEGQTTERPAGPVHHNRIHSMCEGAVNLQW